MSPDLSMSKNMSLRASAHTGVAIPQVSELFLSKTGKFSLCFWDRQEVNCPKGAGEATLECTILWDGSQ